MDPLLISAASGMKARMESLDMLANNMANSGTAGYKADREFYSLYRSELPAELPLVERHWTDFAQGSLLPDGNPLHLGLEGKGFFSLTSPNGIIYSRNGTFRINGQNQLATEEGYTLRNVLNNGQPIVVDPRRPVTVELGGIVRQDGAEIGQIEIVQVADAATGLSKLGTSYFSLDRAGQTTPDTATVIRQGTLEQSNAPASDGAIRLISVMRQFETLQRAMTIGAEMNKQAIEQVARVS